MSWKNQEGVELSSKMQNSAFSNVILSKLWRLIDGTKEVWYRVFPNVVIKENLYQLNEVPTKSNRHFNS